MCVLFCQFFPVTFTLNKDIFQKTMFLAVETEIQDASSKFNIKES